jgi:hypothetical protein
MRYSGVCKGCDSHYEVNALRASIEAPRVNVPHMDGVEAGFRQLSEEELQQRALREISFQCPICHARNVDLEKELA